MLKKLVLASAMIIGFTGLVACSDSSSKKTGNDAVEELGLKLKGTYFGKYTLQSGQVQDIQINFFNTSVTDGKDSDGNTITRSIISATYKRLNPVGTDYNFTVSYVPEKNNDQQIIMTNDDLKNVGNPNTNQLGRDDVHTINGQMKDGIFTGFARSNVGVIGTINVTLQSTESQKPGGTQDEEYYNRLTKQYQTIVGKYAGENYVDGKLAYTFVIDITVIRQGLVPYIRGTFKRDDDKQGSTMLAITESSYQPELSVPTLTLVMRSARFPNSNYTANFYGTLVNGSYKGNWQTNVRGNEGDFVAIRPMPKQEEPTAEQEDEVTSPNLEDAKNKWIPKGKVPVPTPNPRRAN